MNFVVRQFFCGIIKQEFYYDIFKIITSQYASLFCILLHRDIELIVSYEVNISSCMAQKYELQFCLVIFILSVKCNN